ncbi:MAG: flippase [Opitutaceae bacterium]|nr:flippase [Opitutaceae bacterium]
MDLGKSIPEAGRDASMPIGLLGNLLWLIVGRVLRMGLGLAVGAWVARYLAPADFGELSYQIAIVALFVAVAGGGLDGIVVRELLDRRREPGVVLGTAFIVRLALGAVLYLVLLVGYWCSMGGGSELMMVGLLGTDLVFQAAGVFDLSFQARSANKWTVVAGTMALVAASSLRIGLILGKAGVVFFAAAVMFEAAVLAASLAFLYRRRFAERERWQFQWDCARALLAESWPMIVSAVAIAGYMRLDQVLLKALAGDAAVGIYAVAVRLGEAWYFLPMFLGTSLNPWLIQGRALGVGVYRRRLIRLYRITLWSSAGVAVLVAVMAEPVVHWLFGIQYLGAVVPLRLHVLGGVLLAVGIASGKWYVAEGHTVGLMRKALLGLFVGVFVSILLIPRYGIVGAAVGSVAGQLAANVLYDFLDPRVRPQLTLKLHALVPWTRDDQ